MRKKAEIILRDLTGTQLIIQESTSLQCLSALGSFSSTLSYCFSYFVKIL